METDPERPIESLLRACAKKRREEPGASFDLHPATRRLLQGEVARTYGKEGSQGQTAADPIWSFWKRLAWASAAVVALGLGTWLLVPGLRHSNANLLVARNEPAGKPDLAEPAAFPPAPTTPALALAKDETRDKAKSSASESGASAAREESHSELKSALADKDAETRMRKQTAGASSGGPETTVVAQAPPPAANVASTPAAGSAPARVQPATAASPAPDTANRSAVQLAIPPQPTAADSIIEKRLGAAALNAPKTEVAAAAQPSRALQRFVRNENAPADRTNDLAVRSPTASVLASFQVEQSGSLIRITEDDGSVYLGQLQMVPRVLGSPAGARTDALGAPGPKVAERRYGLSAPTASTPAAQAIPSLSFQVEGTNVSLQQRVIFAGRFVAPTNVASAAQGSAASSTAAVPRASALLLGSRIQGTVKLGENPEFKLEAAPVK